MTYKSVINEIISKVAEDKMNMKEWGIKSFLCSFSDNYLANEYAVTLKSKKTYYDMILKISRTASAKLNRFLEKEGEAMKYLSDSSVKCVPMLIDQGHVNGYFYLAQEKTDVSKPDLFHHLSDVAGVVKEAVNEIYSKTKSKEVSFTNLLERASAYLRVPMDYFELGETLNRLEKTALRGDKDLVPTASVHGNLTRNHVMITRSGDAKLLDFVAYGQNEPPIDIPFFILNFNSSRSKNALSNPLDSLKDINKYQPNISPDCNGFLLSYSLIRSVGIKSEILQALEDELLIRDLREFLISNFELKALLEISLNYSA